MCGADINLLGFPLMYLEIKSKRRVLTKRSELCFLYGIEMLDAGPLPIKSRPLMQPWNLTLLTWLPEQVW